MIASCHSALMMIVQACTTVMTEKRTNFGVICPHYLILHTKVSVTQKAKQKTELSLLLIFLSNLESFSKGRKMALCI